MCPKTQTPINRKQQRKTIGRNRISCYLVSNSRIVSLDIGKPRGAALSLLVLITLMIFVVRVAAVSLRLTGLDKTTSDFQALSAFSGTGFTTKESEAIVNYPVRRKIVTLSIIVGNLGLVTVVATLAASFVHTEGELGAVFVQVGWLIGILAVLWFMILNKRAEEVMCAAIGRYLESTTLLGRRNFHRQLQVACGYSVCEHPIGEAWTEADFYMDVSALEELGLMVLAVRHADGELTNSFSSLGVLEPGDTLVLYGLDSGHEALEDITRRREEP
jgi:hypothetical protein